MRKLLLYLSILLFCTATGQTQKEANIWIFGDSAAVDFNAPIPTATKSSMYTFEAAASVCDETGKLLFYTDGQAIWNKNHDLMPNGASLLPILPVSYGSYNIVTLSSGQGALIMPVPGDNRKYYVFSITSQETGINAGRLYYSIVDMTLNNELGDVLPLAKGILVDSNLAEMMTAVAGEACNVWLLTVSQAQNKIKAYSVDAGGIAPPVLSDLHQANNYFMYGAMCVSEDRKKLAISKAGLCLYDFDPRTGLTDSGWVVENFMALSLFYSCAFSPDGTKLYGFNQGTPTILQYNLSAGSHNQIISSRYLVATVTRSSFMKLAPDGKIYIARGGVRYLSGIQAPNATGLACNFVQEAISLQLGTSGQQSLPNIVPIIKRDTFLTSQEQSSGCYSSEPVILNHTVPNSWGVKWENGSTTITRSIMDEGTYWVSYYTASCNFHTDTIHVVFPKIQLTVSPKDTTIKYGDSIMLQATGADYYIWWPVSSLNTDTISILWAKPTKPTIYTVFGLNKYGCRDSATVTIDIDYNIPLLIPNAFSPNGDGLNDVFRISGLPYYKILNFRVFNRWGQQVFETNNIQQGWDGTVKGRPADVGTYHYIIQLVYPNDELRTIKGDLVLLR